MTKLPYLALLFCSQSLLATENTAHYNQYGDATLLNSQQINYDKTYFTSRDKNNSQADLDSASGINLSNTTVDESLDLTSVFRRYSLGNSTGLNGLYSVDLLGNGNKHIISVQQNDFNIIEYKDNQYSVVEGFDSQDYITDSTLLKSIADDTYYLILMTSNQIVKINLLTMKVESTKEVFSSQSVMARDINNDGQNELIAIANSQILILDQSDLSVISQLEYYGNKFVVGSFTEQNVHELMLEDGKLYRISENTIDYTKTLSTQLTGIHLQSVDTNQDGLDEVINGNGWYSIELISPNTDSVMWTANSELDISRIIVADINNDGAQDLVYGDGQWGQIHALSLSTGQEFWQINNPEHSVSSILVDDFNLDGKTDIAWGAGYTSSGDDGFHIHTVEDKSNQWSQTIFSYSQFLLGLADIDGKGGIDVVFSENGTNELQVVDIETNEQLLSSVDLTDGWNDYQYVIAADLFNDDKNYLIVAGSKSYKGNIQVFSPDNGNLLYTVPFESGDQISTIEVYDINQDGLLELIVGNGASHTGSEGSYIRVFNGQTGELIKRSPRLQDFWGGVSGIVTGIDTQQSSKELFALTGNQLVKYNYTDNSVTNYSLNDYFKSLEGVVINGEKALYSANQYGLLFSLTETGEKSEVAKLCDNSLNNIVSTRAGFILFSCEDKFGEYDLNNNELLYEVARANQRSSIVSATYNGVDYSLLSGKSIEVFSNEAPAPLAKPQDSEVTSHVLSPLEVNLNLSDIDFVVFENSPSLGQLTFIDRQTGQFTYTPNGTVGVDELAFYTVKGRSRSELAKFTATLTNQSPVVENSTITTHWNTPLILNLPASDADDEPLIFTVKNEPQHGQIELLDQNTGEIKYTPSGESLQPVSITFTAKDSLEETALANVVVELTNTTPTATDLSYETYYSTVVNGRFIGNDEDSDKLEFELVTSPSSGELSFDKDTGLFVYEPTGESSYSVNFSYRAKDRFASSDTKTVVINIVGKADNSGSSSDSNSDSGGSLYYLMSLLLALVACRRKFKV
ncbi:Ig-like domain-containing protein [Pseudoalteromonas sp. 2CM39R]|uniref:Ig-like domain-containing protein n=1 Tax=Pseudoalteromonas sp. 2CM39R TaxID=2929856 RepID=UPI0020C10787|nr:Ig-like domain-containing protein [Pseudoalteromonas sp. 2CM39R]MCK8125896.1 Ig-like domain-containing protein [Pseudoalteromonas sp. 2CM39R]